MKKIFAILVLSLILVACTNDDDIQKLMAENDYVIIDVRTEQEYNNGHIIDSINIPYDQLNDSIDIDDSKIIFVYCQSGRRSAIAYEKLVNLGYEVYDLGAYEEIKLPKE